MTLGRPSGSIRTVPHPFPWHFKASKSREIDFVYFEANQSEIDSRKMRENFPENNAAMEQNVQYRQN